MFENPLSAIKNLTDIPENHVAILLCSLTLSRAREAVLFKIYMSVINTLKHPWTKCKKACMLTRACLKLSDCHQQWNVHSQSYTLDCNVLIDQLIVCAPNPSPREEKCFQYSTHHSQTQNFTNGSGRIAHKCVLTHQAKLASLASLPTNLRSLLGQLARFARSLTLLHQKPRTQGST